MKRETILEKALEYGIGIDLSGHKIEDVRMEFAKYLERVLSCKTNINIKHVSCSVENEKIVSILVDKQGVGFEDVSDKKEATKFVAPIVKYFVDKTFY